MSKRLVVRLEPERVDVHPRRHLVDAVDVPGNVLEHLADVGRADEDRFRAGKRLASPRGQLGIAPHRVFELRAVCLDDVARARSGGDRRAEEHVIREDDVRRQLLLQRSRVQLDIPLALGLGEVL